MLAPFPSYPPTRVFCETALSVGLVNLKPVVPGHVLVITRRVVPRFADLTPDEIADLWTLAKRVRSVLEAHHGATSLTFAIQDGPQAGQTVPHVHVHVLPRRAGDFEHNDEVYDRVEESGERVPKETRRRRATIKPRRRAPLRTPEDMAAEAHALAALLRSDRAARRDESIPTTIDAARVRMTTGDVARSSHPTRAARSFPRRAKTPLTPLTPLTFVSSRVS